MGKDEGWRKGNIDGLKNESYNYYERRELFKVMLKAISLR